MKTLATTALILISLITGAQNTNLKDVNPKQLCPGDTIRIDFTYNRGPGPHQFNMEGPNMNHIWSFDGSTFESLPRYMDGPDTVYIIKLRTPSWWPKGMTNVSVDWKVEMPVYFTCTTTGLEEQSSGPQEVTYFDLNGQPTQPTAGALLIERRGTKFRKLIIQPNQ